MVCFGFFVFCFGSVDTVDCLWNCLFIRVLFDLGLDGLDLWVLL